ncbi:FxsA family protein [Pseudonocardia sp. H11422]|uniref:FxsA family protein n=1 Tax=Pseudonocardia sp. H11422 TaxID=2835866 RepID=UPI002027FD1F|nr:FxsA family protein [Pseudonocardia sp. H11422]
MPFVLLYLVVEIVALVALGSWIGAGWTLLVLLAGSVLGLWLARREGVRAAQALAEAVRNRRVAHPELTDGLLVAAGGLLLFVPGLVTDLAGLLLVLPPTRALVRRRLVRAAERRTPGLRTARIRADGPVVDGDVVTTGPGGFGPSGADPGSRTAPRAVQGPANGGAVDGVDGIVIDGSVVENDPVDDSRDAGRTSR